MEEDQLKNLSNLLDEVSIKSEDFEFSHKNNRSFNIFKVLHKEHDEVRLHSRFIAFLLSPESSHGKGDYFLKKFLKKINVEFNVGDSIEVYPSEQYKIEYKNIDLLILNQKKKEAIILENKIYAAESNHEDRGQIEGYIDRVKEDFSLKQDDITVIYLTLFGYRPSDDSLGKYRTKVKLNLKLINYREHIIEWLEQCILDNSENLELYLKQYLQIVKRITNYINMKELKKLIAVISDEKALQSSKLLIDKFEEIKKYTIESFWIELENKIKQNGHSVIKSPNIDSFYGNIELRFSTNMNTEFYIYQESNPEEPLYWGWYCSAENEKLEYIKGDFKPIKDYYRKFFYKEVYLFDFNKTETFNLISKKVRTDVINHIMDEIEEILN